MTGVTGFGVTSTTNMREGKILRLQAWLAERKCTLADCDSTFYSDSASDLPLLEAVQKPVAVRPDERLRRAALERGWKVLPG